jgi:hypothetical protein
MERAVEMETLVKKTAFVVETFDEVLDLDGFEDRVDQVVGELTYVAYFNGGANSIQALSSS